MQVNDIVTDIGRMPGEFRRRGDRSMIQLLEESGYFSNSAAVTVQRLRDHFRMHSENLQAWVLHSEDNRSSPSWYIVEPEAANSGARWTVGYHPGDQRETYEHGDEACAVYVKRWLEQIGGFVKHAS